MKRRDLLKTAAVVGASASLVATADGNSPLEIIDSNVSLFHWPFRRLPLDETERLVEKMRMLGVSRMFAGSFEGVFHRDVHALNQRLVAECEKYEELLPVGTVNPAMPGWRRDLEQCSGEFGVLGVRLFPNYHGYELDGKPFRELLNRAADLGLFVQIAAALEDVRMQHPSVKIPDVNVEPLAETIAQGSGGAVQILNWKPRGAAFDELKKLPEVSFDTARVDGTDGIAKLRESVGAQRLLFGSHAPFLVPEAALIRCVHESGFAESALRLLVAGNAEALLNR